MGVLSRTVYQLHTLHRVLKGSWEFVELVHMCFMDLEKTMSLDPSCGGCFRTMWSRARWLALSGSVERPCLRWKSSSILGSQSQVSRLADWCGVCSDEVTVLSCPGEERAERQSSRFTFCV